MDENNKDQEDMESNVVDKKRHDSSAKLDRNQKSGARVLRHAQTIGSASSTGQSNGISATRF